MSSKTFGKFERLLAKIIEFEDFMYLQIFTVFLVLTAASCQKQANRTNPEIIKETVNSNVISKPEENKPNEFQLIESFSDDKKIGIPGKNKIELSLFEGAKNNDVELKFYSLRKNEEWNLKQTLQLENYGSLPLRVELKDFNNDKFKDLTYVSGIAARGANEIRNLFIYDKKKDELVYIKNSGDYPNLLYNKELNCIDSQIFTGSSETVFLILENDTLRKFASVETSNTVNERNVYLIDKNGDKKLLRKDKVHEDDLFERYKTFSPPKTYTSKELKQ